MPELPEVETVIRSLRGPLVGREIRSFHATWANMLQGMSPRVLGRTLYGRTIDALGRRGKYLLFSLSAPHGAGRGRPGTLVMHLKMSGNLEVVPADLPVPAHVRVRFGLDDGTELRFIDPRKFGRVIFTEDPERVVGKLGPEPLADTFTAKLLGERLAGRKGRMKSVLLDQTVVAGLGNIYADEALWESKIHPLTPADRLGDDEIETLHGAIVRVLTRALQFNGTNFGDGVVPYGQYETSAYDRTGEPCARCGSAIERIVVTQRSTHFCPVCQFPARSKRGR